MPTKTYYISKETEIDLREEITKAIDKWSEKFSVERALIKAIINKESGWNAHAYRVDYSALKKQQWYKNTLTSEEQKKKHNWASYGLMQVLYGLARHYGYIGAPRALFDPNLAIYYGTYLLYDLLKRYKGNVKDAIHAYNWGTNAWWDLDGDNIHDENEDYKNQKYVDEVYEYYKKQGGKY